MGGGADRQATQREAAERWKVDRSTVLHICRTARQGALEASAASMPGRSGQSVERATLAAARQEIERLRATVTEQAMVLPLAEGKHVGTDHRPGPRLRVRPRKAGLLALFDDAVEAGWSARRAYLGLGA